MLIDGTYDDQNTQINWLVYSQVALETVGGTAHHLVKQHKDNNNGFAAWKTFCECYEGDSMKN